MTAAEPLWTLAIGHDEAHMDETAGEYRLMRGDTEVAHVPEYFWAVRLMDIANRYEERKAALTSRQPRMTEGVEL